MHKNIEVTQKKISQQNMGGFKKEEEKTTQEYYTRVQEITKENLECLLDLFPKFSLWALMLGELNESVVYNDSALMYQRSGFEPGGWLHVLT